MPKPIMYSPVLIANVLPYLSNDDLGALQETCKAYKDAASYVLINVRKIYYISRRTVASLPATYYDASEEAFEQGDLGTLQRIITSYAEALRTFRAACWFGHLHVAKWVTHAFAFTSREARHNDNYALRFACAWGHLEVAKWLKSTFGLASDDARSCDRMALEMACSKGHLHVCMWLTTEFGLNDDCDTWWALRAACEYGHPHICTWLHYKFGLAYAADTQSLTFVFERTCLHGQLHICKWLHSKFELTPEQVGDSALKQACVGGHIHVCLWIKNTFGVSLQGLEVVSDGHPHMLKWLKSELVK
jgi:hypothetical protein